MSENILIAYYSWSGNTKKIAGMIHGITGGDIVELSPKVPYPRDYSQAANQAKKEIREDFKPELKSPAGDIAAYDKVFIGSPNWWSTIAPPVSSFLAAHDFTGKHIFPFCTHGGGGQGRMVDAVADLCPNARVSECMEVYGSGSNIDSGTLSAWLNRVEFRV